METKIKDGLSAATKAVDELFQRAVAATGAALDSETARALKAKTIEVYRSAIELGKHLADQNGDGKLDEADVKLAAEKIGIAWGKIDPDLKTALVGGAVAAGALLLIPGIGHFLALPAFAAATAYLFLVAKLKAINKK
jgi:hypothetical protein